MQETPGDKAALRSAMRQKRLGQQAAKSLLLSGMAAEHIFGMAEWCKAQSVALYIATRGETDTAVLLDRAWAEGKTVLLPLCLADAPGLMRLVPCAGRHELVPGAYNIPEPRPAALPQSQAPVDFILVPGLAFDKRGIRLGQGGGYYDRLFSRPEYSSSFRLGFAYSWQIVDFLPSQPWDVPVHALCSEEGIQWTA
ncbi:5-formyltetrahydrofolate cyclo-ligase [Desulfovibrio sp. OttesenSCG-928-G15]|nr:5-formyltetrahydrofolate cyclo-ligase [Desulfovibrio sp. OttesenSCG-928-G15]